MRREILSFAAGVVVGAFVALRHVDRFSFNVGPPPAGPMGPTPFDPARALDMMQDLEDRMEDD